MEGCDGLAIIYLHGAPERGSLTLFAECRAKKMAPAIRLMLGYMC